MFTNAILPQKTGAVSFRRWLGCWQTITNRHVVVRARPRSGELLRSSFPEEPSTKDDVNHRRGASPSPLRLSLWNRSKGTRTSDRSAEPTTRKAPRRFAAIRGNRELSRLAELDSGSAPGRSHRTCTSDRSDRRPSSDHRKRNGGRQGKRAAALSEQRLLGTPHPSPRPIRSSQS